MYGGSGLRIICLVITLVLLSVLWPAAAVAEDPGDEEAVEPSGEAAIAVEGMRKGPADAPVSVVVYADFR